MVVAVVVVKVVVAVAMAVIAAAAVVVALLLPAATVFSIQSKGYHNYRFAQQYQIVNCDGSTWKDGRIGDTYVHGDGNDTNYSDYSIDPLNSKHAD